MKHLFLSLTLFTVSSLASAGGIEFFHGSWDEALAQAAREKKLIFVDVYTDWCGPCKNMEDKVFPQASVGKYYNSNFINYKLDAENEEQDGPALAENYDVQAFPTYLYVDADGELKHTAVGYIDAFALVQEGKRAKGEILTATELEKAYNDGRRDPEFVQSYLLASKPYNRETGEPNEELIKLATDYFDNKKTQDWINEADYTLGSMYFTDRKDRFVQFVFSHHKAFSEVVPKQQLADFIVSANTVSMESSALSGDPAYRQYLEEIKGPLADAYRLSGLDSEMALYAGASASSLEEAHRLYSLIGNKNYALSQSNWAEFWALHEQHVASIDEDIKSIIVHTDIANLTNTDCKDVAALTKAKQHAEKAMENEMDRMSITPTYATILVKLGQKEAAQSVLESAAKEAREIGDPFLQSFIEKAQAKLDQ